MTRSTRKFRTDMTPTSLRRLSIRGAGQDKRKEIREAVTWMVPALVGKRMAGNLDITVRFVQNLGHYVGDCEWLDDNISPRQFFNSHFHTTVGTTTTHYLGPRIDAYETICEERIV